jgi:23S rRNA (cytidine1920-2'-O)/16S rRNA (cytidine1409-2'-O)-methyltransferase
VARRVRLIDELTRIRPDLEDAAAHIEAGSVLVDGVVLRNPASLVRIGCSIVVREATELRGSVKLRAALDRFGVEVAGRAALDVGASSGGFTTVLLERGARVVYAVDVGHGQLLGSLRQDPRVRNLEGTNVALLDRRLVPEAIELITVDVSYLSLAGAVRQLDRIELSPVADLIGLVKPMFELKLPSAPADRASLDRALAAATEGVIAAGWTVVASGNSPVAGGKGALELLLHARRRPDGP